MRLIALPVLAVMVWGAIAPVASADNPAPRRWVFTVDNGKPAGDLVVRCDPRGDCQSRFFFKDNGRGPEITERFRIAADGTYTRYAAEGKTTFGSVVDEQYQGKGRGGTWRGARASVP